MVEVVVVLEVRAIDRELVECVQHAFHSIVGGPGVRAGGLEDEHSVIYGRTFEGAHRVDEWWRGIGVWGGAEDNVPCATDVVDFRSPDVSGVWFAAGWVWVED